MIGKKYQDAKPKTWKFWHADFIPKGCITLLVGEGGSGKSTFMSWLADKISKNDCRVAIVSNEEDLDKLTARANPSTDVTFFARSEEENYKKITQQDILDILPDFDVIFVDSFITICPIDCRYAQKVEESFDPFIKAVLGTDKSIVFIHHPNKNGGDSLQNIVAGSERMVSVVRHCNLAINDRIGDRRIITVAKSNCFSTSKNHSFIIYATDRVLPDGGVVKVVDYLAPFTEDLEEVLWKNSKRGKEFLYKKNILKENNRFERECPPNVIKDILLLSQGEDVNTKFIIENAKISTWFYALKNTGEKWIIKIKDGKNVTYHWTDEALDWLENH